MAEGRPPTEPFWQFCAAFNRFGVDYVVIGSEAVAFHGVPRFSVDFDVFVRPRRGGSAASSDRLPRIETRYIWRRS